MVKTSQNESTLTIITVTIVIQLKMDVIGFELDHIGPYFAGLCAQTYPSLLKLSSHVLTVAHI